MDQKLKDECRQREKEYYWEKRNFMQTVCVRVISQITEIEKYRNTITTLNEKLEEKFGNIVYKCVYGIRPGQKFNDYGDRGSFSDTWYRSGWFDFDQLFEDETIEAPTIEEPITVYLKYPYRPSGTEFGREYDTCIHSNCTNMAYMFCKLHDDPIKVKQIILGKEGTDVIDKFMEYHKSKIYKKYNDTIKNLEKQLTENNVPSKVIEVECMPTEEDEEFSVIYVDLLSCDSVSKEEIENM